jgi:hypothetical protein
LRIREITISRSAVEALFFLFGHVSFPVIAVRADNHPGDSGAAPNGGGGLINQIGKHNMDGKETSDSAKIPARTPQRA